MADAHFSYRFVERFLRSELSRGENREFVRHLLRQCPRCSRLIREVASEQNLPFLAHGLEAVVSRLNPDSGGPESRQPLLDRLLRLVGRGRSRGSRARRTFRLSLR